jgi:hypothetical protein
MILRGPVIMLNDPKRIILNDPKRTCDHVFSLFLQHQKSAQLYIGFRVQGF